MVNNMDNEIRPTGGMPNLEWLLNNIPHKIQVIILDFIFGLMFGCVIILIIKSIIN
jgi:hypothetical protein